MRHTITGKMLYALSLGFQLGFIIAIPIAGFLFLGYLADTFFHTQPFMTILGFVIAIIVTMYEIYALLIPLIKNNHD